MWHHISKTQLKQKQSKNMQKQLSCIMALVVITHVFIFHILCSKSKGKFVVGGEISYHYFYPTISSDFSEFFYKQSSN